MIFLLFFVKRLVESFRITWPTGLQLLYDAYQSRIWKMHAVSQEHSWKFLDRIMQVLLVCYYYSCDDSLAVLHCKMCTLYTPMIDFKRSH